MLNSGFDTSYADAWAELLGLTDLQKSALCFYTALFCADFLGELGHRFNGNNPISTSLDVDRLQRLRPYRRQFFDAFVDELNSLPTCDRILELGSGPGFLAEHILSTCPGVREYILLDFSEPMLELSRQRLQQFAARTRFLKADFRANDWQTAISGTVNAAVSMQAVHELRHKRHAHRLYEQVYPLLSDTGALLVCDHNPGSDPAPQRARLYMSIEEKLFALVIASFRDARSCLLLHKMALVRGTKHSAG